MPSSHEEGFRPCKRYSVASKRRGSRCLVPSAVVLAGELIGPEPLFGPAVALGPAHARTAAVLGDELDTRSLESPSQGSGLGSRHRDWPILDFSARDRGNGDLAALSQVVRAPSDQGPRSTKLASGHWHEIIGPHAVPPW